MGSSPPSYTPSPSSPSYSTSPMPGEQCIDFTPAGRSRPVTGTFRRITDSAVLVLRNQNPGVTQPVYGRNGLVEGHISVLDLRDLVEVSIKLEGLLRVTNVGTATNTLFSESYAMWKFDASSSPNCPQTLPFALIFPSTYDDEGQRRAMPPSFEDREMEASCSYTLSVVLSSHRQVFSFKTLRESNLQGLTISPARSVSIPLLYRPRSCPHRPMLPRRLSFMSTIKSAPEEWRQIVCKMATVRGSSLDPIDCLLFIPSIQVFAFSDPIPFHLQLRAPPSSLAGFMPDTAKADRIFIHVELVRQTVKTVHDQRTYHSRVIGTSELHPVLFHKDRHNWSRPQSTDGECDVLDWEGDIHCKADITTIGIITPQLIIKDYITLSLTPSNRGKSPFIGFRHEHPVRLVTDPWTDSGPT